jgi:hypothetical protein
MPAVRQRDQLRPRRTPSPSTHGTSGCGASRVVAIPAFDRTVQRVDIIDREGDVLRMHVKPRGLPQLTFTCHVGHHYLVMAATSRVYFVGIAVRSLGPTHTLYSQLEGIPRPAASILNRLTARHVACDAVSVKQLLERLGGAP